MLIRKYGITLKRLKEDDIELLRVKRNSEAIRQTMYYRSTITPEMQREWFESINNKYNGYFIIIYHYKKIGVIHGKNIDFDKRTCEGGIFIWDMDYLNTTIPSLASIILNDWTFYYIKFNSVFAKVLSDNKTALTYNKMIGYEPCKPRNDDKGVQWLELKSATYIEKMEILRSRLTGFTGDTEPLKMEEADASDDLGKEVKLFYEGLPEDIQIKADLLLGTARRKISLNLPC